MITAVAPQMASVGEAVLFWCAATVMVLGALGVLFFKKAAYSAISMVTVMVGLAVLYLANGAPFMGVVQIVVYTGAIMMLFLFVLMMIGLQATDDYLNQRRGNIIAAAVGGLVLAAALATVVHHAQLPETTGYSVDPYSNAPVENLAQTLFSHFWFSMELAAALLITAALGAVLLTHGDRLTPRRTQKHVVEAKMQAYAASGRHVGQHTAPGVYARSTSVDVGAISGETLEPVLDSVPRVLRVRGLDRSIAAYDPELAATLQAERHGETGRALHGVEGTERVGQSGSWGMGGAHAPDGLIQHVEQRPQITEEGEQPGSNTKGNEVGKDDK